MEEWKKIEGFEKYSVSSAGNVRNDFTGRTLLYTPNLYGVVCVGLMRGLKQHNRSVPLLVARAFVPQPVGPYTTPINLNLDRYDNRADNLEWRPRWFAVLYNRQSREPYEYPIDHPIRDRETREVFPNSFECAIRFGLLEKDLVLSIFNRTYVWPTYQQFEVI